MLGDRGRVGRELAGDKFNVFNHIYVGTLPIYICNIRYRHTVFAVPGFFALGNLKVSLYAKYVFSVCRLDSPLQGSTRFASGGHWFLSRPSCVIREKQKVIPWTETSVTSVKFLNGQQICSGFFSYFELRRYLERMDNLSVNCCLPCSAAVLLSCHGQVADIQKFSRMLWSDVQMKS